jgi:hypothetical protein
MNLVFLDRQGLEFVIIPEYRAGAVASFLGPFGVWSIALATSRAIAVRQLHYRENSIRMEFYPLLDGRGAEQAQVVAFDGKAATPGCILR